MQAIAGIVVTQYGRGGREDARRLILAGAAWDRRSTMLPTGKVLDRDFIKKKDIDLAVWPGRPYDSFERVGRLTKGQPDISRRPVRSKPAWANTSKYLPMPAFFFAAVHNRR
jgi:hypothetical protein